MKKLAKIIALCLAVFSATPSFAATQTITGRQIRDLTITDNDLANGSVTSLKIVDNTIIETDLYAVNAPTDGQCLTYNVGTLSFEWQACVSDNSVTEAMFSSTFYDAVSCTPTVTLVGGTGNVVPVYSTNNCRVRYVGVLVFVDINLVGDGGTEGAGSGQINVALPYTSSSISVGLGPFPCGTSLNNNKEQVILCTIGPLSNTVQLHYNATAASIIILEGVDQNNTTRQIRIKFFYEREA